MTGLESSRPKLLIATRMAEALTERAFSPGDWARLTQVTELLNERPLAELTSPQARALLAEAEVLLTFWGCPTIDEDVLDAAPRLKLVVHAAGSVKGHVSRAVWDRGIVVTSAAAANGVTVAEYTLGVMLMAGKDVFRIRDSLRSARGANTKELLGELLLDPGQGNYGRKVGIVGASHIGRKVIELMRPFGWDVAVSDPYLTDEAARALGVEKLELDKLLGWADVVSLHAPSNETTHQMIGAEQLAQMREGTWLINTARGKLIDTAALEVAVRSGRVRAVIDTPDPEPFPPESPLYDAEGAVLTPHISGPQGNELVRLGALALAEIERAVEGRAPLYPLRSEDLDHIA